MYEKSYNIWFFNEQWTVSLLLRLIGVLNKVWSFSQIDIISLTLQILAHIVKKNYASYWIQKNKIKEHFPKKSWFYCFKKFILLFWGDVLVCVLLEINHNKFLNFFDIQRLYFSFKPLQAKSWLVQHISVKAYKSQK